MLTLKDLAEYLHCHTSTVYRLVKQGKIPGFALGGSWRFLRPDVDKWIAAGGGKPSEEPAVKPDGGAPKRKPRSR